MTCNDCIGYKFCSRGRNGLTDFYGKESACNNVEYLCQDFKNKADFVEVKHGKWIRKGNEKKCSVCGFVYYSNNDEWNGCPNCLAKMDGGAT